MNCFYYATGLVREGENKRSQPEDLPENDSGSPRWYVGLPPQVFRREKTVPLPQKRRGRGIFISFNTRPSSHLEEV